MKLITNIFLIAIGLAHYAIATPSTNQQLQSTCKTILDWLRTDDEAFDYIKYEERDISSDFIALLESAESTESICGSLAIRQTGNTFIIGAIVRVIGAIAKGASRGSKVGRAARKGAKVGHHLSDHDDRHRNRHRRHHF